jgi:hypothetical protein
VELIFSVPVCWTTRSNAIMSGCIEAAMREAQFGVSKDGDVGSLFMVNEAEAGASHALASHMLLSGLKAWLLNAFTSSNVDKDSGWTRFFCLTAVAAQQILRFTVLQNTNRCG